MSAPNGADQPLRTGANPSETWQAHLLSLCCFFAALQLLRTTTLLSYSAIS